MKIPEQIPELYRLHIRPAGDAQAAFDYCVAHGVLGTGWGTTRWGDPTRTPKDWDEYLALARELWSDKEFGPVRAFHDANTGSLVWTRDPHGIYYLTRLTAPWEYRDDELNRTLDLNNVRRATIVAVPGADGAVPGAVVRAFSGPGQAFRRVPDPGAGVYSAYLFARLTGAPPPAWTPTVVDVLDSLLDPFDVEDLVAAYLQAERGLIALPARRNASTLAYEYTLRDPANGQIYAVQVKTGDAPVPTDELASTEGLRWIVFSARERYPSKLPTHVEAIAPATMIEFMTKRPNALPPVVSTWLALVAETGPS